MLAVEFDGSVAIDGKVLDPGVKYVVSEDIAQTMIRECAKVGRKLIRHSGFNSFGRSLRPNDTKAGNTVVIWRHNAFGDNLMITGLCAYLRRGLGLNVHVACANYVHDIWRNMDQAIKPHEIITTPVNFEPCKIGGLYNEPGGWSVFYQAMLEENREQDQGNAIDDLWRFAGFDMEVAENYRRPILREFPIIKGDDIGLALHSGNGTRTQPLDWNVKLCHEIQRRFPSRTIRVFGMNKEMGAVFNKGVKVNNISRIINHVGEFERFGQTMQVMEEHCGTVISPDSALLHLAEGLGIPNIGLWGLFDPDDRAKYYKYHTAISNFDACSHAPCRWHGMNEFPLEKCGKLKAPGCCNALSSIDVTQVVDAIK